MRPAFVLLAVGMCGGCRGRYGASATLGQVWRGGSKQEGVQRRGMAGAGMGRHWRRCGRRRGRYGASVTLEQVWRGGSKQEGVQRRCLEREGGWWALHRQQLSFRSGVQSRLMFEMCGGCAGTWRYCCRCAQSVFVRWRLGRSGWFYLVRRERRTDGRKASLLACVRVAAPLMAILLPAERFGVFARWRLGAVWLVLSCAAGAEDGRQKSVIVGVRAGCRAVDGGAVWL